MKRRFRIFLALCVVALAIWLYFRFRAYTSSDPLNLIPSDAIYILEADDPIENWNFFSRSKFWSFLKTHPDLHELTEDAEYLDSLIQSNRTLFKHFGDRHFILSAHMTLKRDYDFLWGFDLKQISRLDLSPLLLKYALDEKAFTLRKRNFEEHIILEIEDLLSRDILYISQVSNYLMFSYSASILENCISEHEDAPIAGNIKFREVYRELSNGGLARFYIQHENFDNFLQVYTRPGEGILALLGSNLQFSGYELQLEDSELEVKGYSALPDIDSGYLRLVQKHGNSGISFDKILSNRTAFAQAICLNDFETFYSDLEALGATTEIEELKRDVEGLLKLSLKDDFLSWFGNEIVAAYNRPSDLHYSEDDLLIAVKTSDDDLARKKLDKIQKQIKKRSPARFKTMTYKGYPIQYLQLKGFFKLFLGKSFNKITRPYYTIIDDFVVFSNSPKTLVALLEDYENQQTLDKLASFADLRKKIPKKTSIFSYLNGPLAYPVFRHYVRPEQMNDYDANKKYFQFFQSVGISFKSSKAGFDAHLYMTFGEPDPKNVIRPKNVDSIFTAYFVDPQSELDEMGDADRFVLEKIQKGKYTRYYLGTRQEMIIAHTRDGMLHGSYREYYPDGKIKVEGKYKKGKKRGVWKYFNKDGKLEEREWQLLQ